MWFTETPWPPIAILGLVALGSLFVAMQTQVMKWLVPACLCVVLACVVWTVERAIVTPGEKVEGSLLAMIDAFQKKNEAQTLRYISPAPASAGLVALAKTAMKLVDVKNGYTVSDIQINTFANDTAATCHFRVNGTVSTPSQGNVGHQPFRFNGKWRLEGGEWRLTEIEDLNPINGEVLNRFNELK
jgi:hypothetical protein